MHYYRKKNQDILKLLKNSIKISIFIILFVSLIFTCFIFLKFSLIHRVDMPKNKTKKKKPNPSSLYYLCFVKKNKKKTDPPVVYTHTRTLLQLYIQTKTIKRRLILNYYKFIV